MKNKIAGFKRKSLAYCKMHWRLFVAAGLIVAISAGLSTFVLKTTLPVAASVESETQAVHEPIVLKLNQKLAHLDISKLSLSPEVEGKWSYTPGTLLSSDTVSFTPKTVFKTDTTYKAQLAGIKRIVAGSDKPAQVSFKTEAAPRITSSTQTDQPLGAVTSFTVTLSTANRDLRDLKLKTTPEVELTRSSKDDVTFEWTPAKTWPQGSTVEIEVIDAKNSASLQKSSVTIAPEPIVSSPVKVAYFTDKDTADITFSQPIDRTKDPSIKFNLEGKGDWLNDNVYRFTPSNVSPGQTYSYVVAAGLTSKQGGVLQQPFQGSFKTTGAVQVSRTFPSGTLLKQSGQEMSFKFDQVVDKASAEQRFSVSHGQTGQMRWSGDTLIVPVTNLGFGQTVVAQISAGVKNSGFGLPSTQSFSIRFTTENRVTRLNIPFYRQQHSATCAVASLRMALAYRGVNTSEEDIVSRMGYAPRSIDRSTNPPTWDDPGQMFVGSIDGSISKGTGAGPDAPPVANASSSYGRNAQAITRASPGWIASQVHAGNPVVMFGAQSASSGMTKWQTSSGKTIIMNLTSHAVLVTGVVGEPSAPIGFWVSDPLSGANAYWTTAAVTSNISRDPDAQAVVVF